VCQPRKDFVVDLTECAVDVGKESLARSRERHDGAPAVGAITAPLDQACILEAVEDRHKIGGVDPDELHQGLLGAGAALAQVDERQEFIGTEPGGRDRLFDASSRAAGELGDQQEGRGPDF
jgi:hypothetical protein